MASFIELTANSWRSGFEFLNSFLEGFGMKVNVEFENGDLYSAFNKAEFHVVIEDVTCATDLLGAILELMPVNRQLVAFWLLLNTFDKGTINALTIQDFEGLEEDVEKLIAWIKEGTKVECSTT
jgi:hypothetical protein